MAALRLIPREEWAPRLTQQHHCERAPVAPFRSGLKSGEWWVTENDRLFPVPCDSEGRLRSEDWQEVLVLIAKLKPLDLDN
jgi:hypothetical protein